MLYRGGIFKLVYPREFGREKKRKRMWTTKMNSHLITERISQENMTFETRRQ